MAKYIDNTGLATVWAKIKATFVAKESGKGLSSNDYTAGEKSKLSGIATGAQVNVIEKINVNGTAQSISSKAVSLTIPTKTSEITNDSGYQTSSQVSSAITSAISGITSFKYQVVTSLPGTGVAGTIYLMANSGSGQNVYDEYIWVGSKYEKLGQKDIDLSAYMQKSEMVALSSSEIDGICV